MFLHVDEDPAEVVDVESDFEDSFTPAENQCHLCREKLQSNDDLIYHVKTMHEVYYQGMLEAAANLSSYDCIRT